MHVADIGAGSGFYTFAASKIVGGNGRVYAIDIQKELLSKIKNEAIKKHLPNIEVIWGNAESPGGTKLRDNSVDAVIASNIFFQVENKQAFVHEAKRILKPKGRLLFIDWRGTSQGLGPKTNEVTASSVHAIFETAGFKKESEWHAGSHHYGIIFRKL